VKRKHYLAVVKRISDAYLHDTLLIPASSMEPNINLQLLCNKRSSSISHIANMLTSKENKLKKYKRDWCYACCIFLFSIHKIVRSADTDKIANLAQQTKSLGTAALDHYQ